MKICLITRSLKAHDGWAGYARSLSDGLVKNGLQVEILSEDNLLPPLFISRFKKVYYLFKNYFRIKKVIQNCDLVHVIAEPYAPLLYNLIKIKPYFITAHGTYAVHPLTKKYLFKIYKKVYTHAEKIICVSKFTQQKILNYIKLNNTCVIHNGVNSEKFKVQKLNNKQFQILTVGVIIPRKAYHLNIQALGELKKIKHDFKYVIVGTKCNEEYYKNLLKLIQENSLTENIIFKENLSEDELVELYKQSNLFLLVPEEQGQTKFEGFGLVYLEAMAAGVPVLAARDSAAEEFIQDSVNGFLIDPDSEHIYKKINYIINSPKEYINKIINQAVKTAQKFSWQNVVKEYAKIYGQCRFDN
jgi:glycosyltransferase involved in cell wall biosynthesis